MEPVSAEVWKGFIDALDQTDLEQKCDLERVDGVSFVPAPGEEITVDYGPRYAYEQHGFARAPAPNPRRLRRLGRNPFRDP